MEADFRQYYSGLDLNEMLGEYRYRETLSLVLQLPNPESRFWGYVNGDIELYASLNGIDLEGVDDEEGAPEAGDPAPPYQQVGMNEILLMELFDLLNSFRAESAFKGSKKKPPKIKRFPRPKSVSSQIKAERDRRWAEDFEAELKAMAVTKRLPK